MHCCSRMQIGKIVAEFYWKISSEIVTSAYGYDWPSVNRGVSRRCRRSWRPVRQRCPKRHSASLESGRFPSVFAAACLRIVGSEVPQPLKRSFAPGPPNPTPIDPSGPGATSLASNHDEIVVGEHRVVPEFTRRAEAGPGPRI